MSTARLIAAVVDSFGEDRGGKHRHVLTLALTAALTKYLADVALDELQGLNEPRQVSLPVKPPTERAH